MKLLARTDERERESEEGTAHETQTVSVLLLAHAARVDRDLDCQCTARRTPRAWTVVLTRHATIRFACFTRALYNGGVFAVRPDRKSVV